MTGTEGGWIIDLVRELPLDPRGAGLARGLARQTLESRDRDTVDTVELLVSELFVNSLSHAESVSTMKIETGIGTDAIRVTVSDLSPIGPRVTMAPPEAESGRGCQLVEALSKEWGWTPTANGKSVWFVI